MMTSLALINAVSLVRSLFLAAVYNLLLHYKLAEGLFLSGFVNFSVRSLTSLNGEPKATEYLLYSFENNSDCTE